MRKLIYSMTVSLDGYIAGPDGTIGWCVPDEELSRSTRPHVRGDRCAALRTAAL